MAFLAALVLLSVVTVYGDKFLHQNLNFSTTQATRIWESPQILGNSTHFEYPLSMGTATTCDEEVEKRVFDSEYKLFPNYTEWNTRWDLDTISVRYYAQGFAFKQKSRADTKIENDIVSLKACFSACINMKDFNCLEFDFYKTEGNICSLYTINGVFVNPNLDHFIGTVPSSDHYTLFKRGESRPPCNVTYDEYAYPYFAIGWKAMEAGWYTLAHDQFEKALDRDPKYYMAMIGKCLSNEDMGYGIQDDLIGSCKDKLNEIKDKPELKLRLSYQDQLVLSALVALHNAETLDEGLLAMGRVFRPASGEQTTETNDMVKIIEGNAMLLSSDEFSPLATRSRTNIFAIQYLTHNLNPFKKGKGRTAPSLRAAATSAVFNFKALEVDGAWRITSDCIDVAEFYAKWSLGANILSSQRDFLFRNTAANKPESLFREDEEDIIVNGLDVKYMSRSLKRINEYERLHFFYLQMGKYEEAQAHLDDRTNAAESDDDEQRKNLRLRMAANAYFTTYDYIFDTYANEMKFDSDWQRPLDDSTNDLALASRAYYWAAAAVQKARTGEKEKSAQILKKISQAEKKTSYPEYKKLVAIYVNMVKATQLEKEGKYVEAMKSVELAGKLHKDLVGVDFTISDVPETQYFRLLIPIGYQFQADMLRVLKSKPAAVTKLPDELNIDAVLDAYKTAVETPPLNTSRLMKAYGDMLFEKYGNAPKKRNEEHPPYVPYYESLLSAWAEADPLPVTAETSKKVDEYYEKPFTDCSAEIFQIRSEKEMCWGGYVIIGISVAIVVIIIIIIGILCLRRKAVAPQKDKEKAQEFIFSGPDLSQRDDYNGSLNLGSISQGSPESSHYASQTLDIKRNYADSDYTNRSQTAGGGAYTEAYSAH